MSSTFSSRLRLELIGAGEQSGAWNNTTNTNLGTLLDEAVAGVAPITLSSTAYTLDESNGASDEARQAVLVFSGTPGGVATITCPTVEKTYIIKNATSGGNKITVKTSAGGSPVGVDIPNGSIAVVYTDGADFFNAVKELAAGATSAGVELVTVSGSQTLTNKTLTAPKFADGGFIADANGNEIVVLDTVASAVNEITVANAATGAGPSVAATGVDTNIDLFLAAKGTGVVKAGGVEVVTLSGTQSLSNKTIASPSNVSATTGNAAIIAATGPDTNIDINLTPKGSGSVLFGGASPSFVPTGSVIPFAGATAPTGWLLSFGQNVSRSTYAALFAVIGTTYGVGDGSTTFGLPDLRGRVIAGQDDMGGTSANRLTGLSGGVDGDILGGTGGLETHTLTESQIPAHRHLSGITQSGSSNAMAYGSTAISPSTSGSMSEDGDNGTITSNTSNTGGGTAHNNVQPTIILNYIIKI